MRTSHDVTAHSLYNSTKLLPHDVARFAQGLTPYDDSSRGDGKPTFYAFPALKSRLAAVRPLKAVLLLRVHDSPETTLQPAGAGEAWKAVGPSTLSLVPSDVGGFQWLAALVSDLPALASLARHAARNDPAGNQAGVGDVCGWACRGISVK